MPPTAIVAFFSPCDYKLPRKHLAATLKWLLDEGLHVICAQVVRPGQKPEYVPPAAERMLFESDDTLFFKENLWNLAAAEADSDTLLFFDSDVYIRGNTWLRDTLKLLESHDILQPFEAAAWTSREGTVEFSRRPTASAIARSVEPHPGHYHPGFAWAFRRDSFLRIGGWYDRHPAGGSDTAFAYTLYEAATGSPAVPPSGLLKSFCECPSFREYCSVVSAYCPSVSITRKCIAVHRWHGSWKDRGYVTRDSVFPIGDDGEYEVKYRADGLLSWYRKDGSARAMKYFMSRKEDG